MKVQVQRLVEVPQDPSIVSLHNDDSTDEHVRWRTYRAVEVLSLSPKVSIACALGTSILDVTDIGHIAEVDLLARRRDRIELLHSRGRRVIFVIDTTYYPDISTMIDIRDQLEVNDDDGKFSVDVKKLWTTYNTASTVPMIIVNLHTRDTILKCASW